MTILIVIVLTFVYGSFSGYLVHRLLHTKIFGKLAESHNTHHTLYSVDDFEDSTYRNAKENDSIFVFVPIITCAIILMCIPLWFIFAWWVYPIVLIEGIFVGWLNDHCHEAFHISNHRYNKYNWFRKLKDLHRVHHAHPEKNHAIIWFGPDRVCGTFSDNQSL